MDLEELLLALKAAKFESNTLTDEQIEYLIDIVEDEIDLMKDIVV